MRRPFFITLTIVPESFHHMHLDGVDYRRLADQPGLKARIDLVCPRTERSAASAFFALVRTETKRPSTLPAD
jgi:hypothetical protein